MLSVRKLHKHAFQGVRYGGEESQSLQNPLNRAGLSSV
jgi:hypothetical protein